MKRSELKDKFEAAESALEAKDAAKDPVSIPKKDELPAELKALDAKEAAKELLSIPLKDEVPAGAKGTKKDEVVEAQLKDLLDSVDKDKQSDEKKDEKSKKLNNFIEKFDTSSAVVKDDVINMMEDIIRKEVLSSDMPEDSRGKCKDDRSDCLLLARKGYCGTHENVMRAKCARTCQYCVDCFNKLKPHQCKKFARYGYCKSPKYKSRMKKLCFKTCGYCSRASIQVRECAKSKFGCCWDKRTPKSDRKGSECPKCEDQYPVTCDRFKDHCASDRIAGEFMRTYCPKKCSMCHECLDDFKYKERCSMWKQLGWCMSMKPGMKVLCPKTCEFC